MRRIVECVANFSEGRDLRIVDAIAEVIERGHTVALLHRTSDADHNRSVLTFAGTPESVVAAAVRAVAKAAETIDLNRHRGVHPRLGAADVVPFVPVEGLTLEDCAELAHRAGEAIWREAGVPVYFYEAAALAPERKQLEDVRRGEFEGLRLELPANAARRPDIGGPALHPTAGAVIVGARKPLIAWNVILDTADTDAARAIAKRIRASSGGLPHVKALGLWLESRGRAQVSMNLTDYEATPMHAVYEAIRQEAARLGVAVEVSELIGLVPRGAVDTAAASYLRIENFRPDTVLETKIAQVLPYGIDDLLDNLADPSRAAGGGSAAALSAAMAAALGCLVARLQKHDPTRWDEHRAFFAEAVRADAEAFASLMRTAHPPPEAVMRAAEAPLAIAERALEMGADLRDALASCPPPYASDLETAAGLAAAAVRGARSTAALNVERLEHGPDRARLEARLRTLQ